MNQIINQDLFQLITEYLVFENHEYSHVDRVVEESLRKKYSNTIQLINNNIHNFKLVFSRNLDKYINKIHFVEIYFWNDIFLFAIKISDKKSGPMVGYYESRNNFLILGNLELNSYLLTNSFTYGCSVEYYVDNIFIKGPRCIWRYLQKYYIIYCNNSIDYLSSDLSSDSD
jgi:hypothetical protein